MIFVKLTLMVWIGTFVFVASERGGSDAFLAIVVGPMIILWTVLIVTWPVLLAGFGIWGALRLIRAARTEA